MSTPCFACGIQQRLLVRCAVDFSTSHLRGVVVDVGAYLLDKDSVQAVLPLAPKT